MQYAEHMGPLHTSCLAGCGQQMHACLPDAVKRSQYRGEGWQVRMLYQMCAVHHCYLESLLKNVFARLPHLLRIIIILALRIILILV